jgi:hypothetical protein
MKKLDKEYLEKIYMKDGKIEPTEEYEEYFRYMLRIATDKRRREFYKKHKDDLDKLEEAFRTIRDLAIVIDDAYGEFSKKIEKDIDDATFETDYNAFYLCGREIDWEICLFDERTSNLFELSWAVKEKYSGSNFPIIDVL